MTQMTTAQARVIDPVLTNVARGYQNAEFVFSALFPVVPVGQRGGKIITFGKEHFRLYETLRAPGANVARAQASYGSDSYALEQHAIEEPVPFELLDDAAAVPGIDLGRGAVARGMDIIGLRVEKAAADLARNPAGYDVGNTVALAGTSQWSDPASDPIANIESYKEVVRGKIGRRPNTLLISGQVFAALKTNPAVVGRLKYTQREVATPDLLASLFGLDRVVVGDAIFESGGTMADVWGKDAILAYTDTGSLDAARPSFGYTYRLRNYPIVEQPYAEKNVRSWIYPTIDEVQPVIAGPDAGFLIQNAVA